MKKIIPLLAAGVLASALLPSAAFAERMYPKGDNSHINVYVNGTLLKLDQPALVKNDRTLVPFRAVLEALGAEVAWDEETQTVYAQKGDIGIELPLHSTTAWVNEEVIDLDVPAEQINYRTMVPLRFMSEALDASLGWAGKTSSVFVSTYEADEAVPAAKYFLEISEEVNRYLALQETSRQIYNNFIDQKVSFAEFKSAYDKNLADLQATFDKIHAYEVPNDPLSQHLVAQHQKILQKALDMLTQRGQIFSANGTYSKDKLSALLTAIDEMMSDDEAFQMELDSSMK